MNSLFTPCYVLARCSFLFAVIMVSLGVDAQPIKPQQDPVDQAIPDNIQQQIYTRLKESRPDLTPSNLSSSPMSGLYKIQLNGQLAFISRDGRFLVAGEIYKIEPGGLVSLQEEERERQDREFAPKRAEMLAAVDRDDLVIFTPEKEAKGHVYIFTDIDCGFCRQLHGRIENILAKGIEVRYLAFPRAGINSLSAQKLATTWCADNPQEIMTRYKLGETITSNVCAVHPVADHYILGQEVGVNATPTIVLESGQLIAGAVSADILASEMGL